MFNKTQCAWAGHSKELKYDHQDRYMTIATEGQAETRKESVLFRRQVCARCGEPLGKWEIAIPNRQP